MKLVQYMLYVVVAMDAYLATFEHTQLQGMVTRYYFRLVDITHNFMRIRRIWNFVCPPHNINYTKNKFQCKIQLGANLTYVCIPTT